MPGKENLNLLVLDLVIFRKSACNKEIVSNKVTLLTVVKVESVVNDFF